MRIGLVSEFFYPSLGGIQEHLYSFSKELIRRGHSVRIITPKIPFSGEFEEWWPKDLPREVYCPIGWSLPFFINGSVGRTCVGFRLGHQLKKLLTPTNFDLIHLHSPLVGILPVLANHFSSVRTFGTFHTSFADSANLRLYHFFAKRHIERLEKIICVSPASLDSIRRIFDLEAHIIPNGIDTEMFYPFDSARDDRLQRFTDGKINILFIGRADPRNGIETLIKAFVRAKAAAPNLRLIIAGGGDLMATYKSMAANLNARDIEFLGPVREERPQIYRTAHIQVFGVQRAAFAVTLLEGMASGLPIITTDFEGYEFAGIPEKHFVISPFGKILELEKQILRLAEDVATRKMLSVEARKRSLEFSWPLVAERILQVYQRE